MHEEYEELIAVVAVDDLLVDNDEKDKQVDLVMFELDEKEDDEQEKDAVEEVVKSDLIALRSIELSVMDEFSLLNS